MIVCNVGSEVIRRVSFSGVIISAKKVRICIRVDPQRKGIDM